MKKNVCIIIALLIAGYSYSQDINFKLGINSSSLDFEKNNFFNSNITNTFAAVSLDYLNMGNFYLSSQLGFLQKGGKEKDVTFHLDESVFKKEDVKVSWKYINFNTTIRYRLPFKNNYFFAGIGPSLDILANKETLVSVQGYSFVLKRASISAKVELGFEHKFENRLKLGANLSYLHGLSYTGRVSQNNFYCNSFEAALLLGYSFTAY